MDKELAVEITRDYIIKDDPRITYFKDIFKFVDRTQLHQLTGINYDRLKRIIRKPKTITYEDAYSIAWALKVPPQKISALIHAEIDADK